MDPATFAWKVNVASVLSVISAGPVSMVVTGGSSTIQVWLAGVTSKLPAASLARINMVCEPCVRSENCCGATHELYAVPSRAHSKVRSGESVRLSLPVKEKVAISLGLGLVGAEVMVVLGGVTSGPSSTTHS